MHYFFTKHKHNLQHFTVQQQEHILYIVVNVICGNNVTVYSCLLHLDLWPFPYKHSINWRPMVINATPSKSIRSRCAIVWQRCSAHIISRFFTCSATSATTKNMQTSIHLSVTELTNRNRKHDRAAAKKNDSMRKTPHAVNSREQGKQEGRVT